MPPTKIGKYEIVRELGKGAMGLVYEARDPHIGRKVAVKTIRFEGLSDPSLQSDMRKRFMREAQSAGILHHPHIVTIYEVGEDEGFLYIAMEYIEGHSLARAMSPAANLTVADVARLLCSVGEALDYAHRKGIIHRDVKPANVLIDAEGQPRLVDFGIAHLPTSTITHTGMSMGTPSYMAPEQIVGQKIDGRADVFSLGVILYELLTKEKPFAGDNVTTIIYKIMNEDPRPPREVNHGLPEGLAAVVEKALAKNPADRFQTAGEFVAALSAFAKAPRPEDEDKTVVFRSEIIPPSPKPRKIPVVLAGAVAVFILLAAVVVFLATRRGSSSAAGLSERPDEAPSAQSVGEKSPASSSSKPAPGVTATKNQDRPPAKSTAKPQVAPKTAGPDAPDKKSAADQPEEEPRPVRALGDIKPPKQTRKVEAVYPEEARRAGVEGFVILEVTTDSRGRVANVKVLRSLPGCDQAAIDAVRQYLYEPVLVRGKPRGVIFSTTVFFKKS